MASTSSSDEEELARFVEAADTSLYYNALYRKNQGQTDVVAPEPALPSLRNIDDGEEDRLNNELRVTASFQKHVAKHLTRILDDTLQLDEPGPEGKNPESTTAKTVPAEGSAELKGNIPGRKIARAARASAPSKVCPAASPVLGSADSAASTASGSTSGVRLLGASAVFLTSCNITPPLPQRRRKRGRKVARISSGSDSSSDSSSDDSDSDVVQERLSSVVVTPDWVLSGEATKGWARNTRGEVVSVGASGEVQPLTFEQGASRYGSVQNLYSSSSNSSNNNNNNDYNKEVLSDTARGDVAYLQVKKKCKKKRRNASLDGNKLAATFSSAVNLNSEESAKPKRKKCKIRKEQQSEDATTETTEVEDGNEGRKKKKKKKKKAKIQRREDARKGEEEMMRHVVPGLLDDDDDEGIGEETKKKKKKRKREIKNLAISKKKLGRRIIHLSTDLARLMMSSNDAVVS